MGFSLGQSPVAFARLVGVKGCGIVEDEFFVAVARLSGVAELLLVELGTQQERIVGQEVVGIELDALSQQTK